MGDKANDILESFRLSDAKQKLYETVRGKFELFFKKKRNVVFDQISFFRRRQEEEEPVAYFVNNIQHICPG